MKRGKRIQCSVESYDNDNKPDEQDNRKTRACTLSNLNRRAVGAVVLEIMRLKATTKRRRFSVSRFGIIPVSVGVQQTEHSKRYMLKTSECMV